MIRTLSQWEKNHQYFYSPYSWEKEIIRYSAGQNYLRPWNLRTRYWIFFGNCTLKNFPDKFFFYETALVYSQFMLQQQMINNNLYKFGYFHKKTIRLQITHTHTHTYIPMNICIYLYICVRVCVCVNVWQVRNIIWHK